jgi:cytochrome b561
MKPLVIAAVLATIALGVAVGVLYLQRARRHRLVKLHLYVALAGTALVAALVATAPVTGVAGPPGWLTVAMIAFATAIGYGATRVFGRSRLKAELALAAHIVLGVAGFFVLLAYGKAL